MSYTLPEFLAHAVALESEAAERYLELADMMEAHRNDAVANVFRDMVRYSRMHRDEVVARAAGIELPKLRMAQFRWRTPPEVGGEEAFDYTLHAFDALTYARENEVRAMEYYRSVAAEATDTDVRKLAAEFADEESGHVAALDHWLERMPRP
jgi:rubrerythrin